VSLSCRLLGALDQPGIGNKVLDRGKAIDVVDLVEDDQGKLLPTSNVSESLKGRSSARKFLALPAAPV
jgi:hypothetical protein